MNITILYSGGLDSRIMYHMAKVRRPNDNIRCLWFDIGQPYNKKEFNALPEFVEKRKLEWLSRLDESGNWVSDDSVSGIKGKGNETGQIYIPGRNAVLITLAACLTLADEVWLGALLGETHENATDKNEEFLHRIQSMLTYTLSPFRPKDNPVKIRYPLAEFGLNKLTSVKWALDHGLPISEILKTSSCLSGEPGNCGKCVVCFRRWGIFKQLGFSEQYNVDPLSVEENKAIVREMLKGDSSYYDQHRRQEILPALPQNFLESL